LSQINLEEEIMGSKTSKELEKRTDACLKCGKKHDYKHDKTDATVLFHIKRANKEKFTEIAKLEGLSFTGLLNALIVDYISNSLDKLKQLKPKKTGRGNTNVEEIEKAKEYFRRMHPNPVRKIELANYIGCSQTRALIILNILSGVSNDKEKDDAEFIPKDFLVGENDDQKPLTYFIYKDKELGIDPWQKAK
jgi:hypothetical protein